LFAFSVVVVAVVLAVFVVSFTVSDFEQALMVNKTHKDKTSELIIFVLLER